MNLFLPYAPTRPFSLMMRQARHRLTVTPDLPGDAFILREPYRLSLAAWAATTAGAAGSGAAGRPGRERREQYVGLATPGSPRCADMGQRPSLAAMALTSERISAPPVLRR